MQSPHYPPLALPLADFSGGAPPLPCRGHRRGPWARPSLVVRIVAPLEPVCPATAHLRRLHSCLLAQPRPAPVPRAAIGRTARRRPSPEPFNTLANELSLAHAEPLGLLLKPSRLLQAHQRNLQCPQHTRHL